MPGILVPFLKQVVRDVASVAETLDALVFRVDLTLVTDEKLFKIFTAVHIIKLFMLKREGRNICLIGQCVSFGCLLDM